MKILYLTYFLRWAGLERQLSYLASELARTGHEVHIAYLSIGHDGGRGDLRQVHCHEIAKTGHYDPLIIWRLVRLIRSIRPDVVQTWHYLMDVFGGLASSLTRTPWVLRDPLPDTDAGGWRKRARIWVAGTAGRIVSNSSEGERYWLAHRPTVPRTIVPNGIPFSEIEDVAPCREAVSTNGGTVLYVGQLLPRKGVSHLIGSLAAACRESDLSALLCGDGPQRDDLQMLASQCGVADKVRFLGQVSKNRVWSLMKAATVFAFLSEHEGCPNAVLEAMACNCPVLVSDIPAHREILDDSSARFVDPNDTQQVAKAMLEIVRDKDAARSRAARARERIQHRSIPAMTQEYLTAYMSLAGSC